MNPQLINKLIKFNNDNVPQFSYSNPLLDRNVTRALSKSFVKILTSEQNGNVNKNLRLSIIENIRKMCRGEPEGHLPFNGEETELLVDFYRKHIMDLSNSISTIEKKLDAFIIRNFIQLNISTSSINVNPESIQALVNLNEQTSNQLSLDSLIYWDTSDIKSMTLLNNLLKEDISSAHMNDIVIKNKPAIEKLLLDTCLQVLEDRNVDIKVKLKTSEEYRRLFKTCTKAPYCYEICIYILNLLFISTNFDLKIHEFIKIFVDNVKEMYSESISRLYPIHLSHAVLVLDVDLSVFPSLIKEQYVDMAVKCLKNIHSESESDFILLLSHYPHWFSITM